jgi:hypothetical protein
VENRLGRSSKENQKGWGKRGRIVHETHLINHIASRASAPNHGPRAIRDQITGEYLPPFPNILKNYAHIHIKHIITQLRYLAHCRSAVCSWLSTRTSINVVKNIFSWTHPLFEGNPEQAASGLATSGLLEQGDCSTFACVH